MPERRFVLVFFLILLVAAGCKPPGTPAPATEAPSSPVTQVAPPPTPAAAGPVSTTVPAALPTEIAPPTPPATPAAGDARFGACFLSTKLNVTDLPCADLQEMGVHNTFFGAWWGQVEPQPGKYDWSSVDGPVDAALACGVEPVIKISAGPGPGQDSTPPEDLDAYGRFVAALAEHLKGRVRAYAIENELNNGRMVSWTGETYGPVRAAAYEAIKSVDPEATVLDSGLTMQGYLPARASELVQAGKPDEAIAILQRFEASMTRTQKDLPATEEDLSRWLGNDVNQRGVGLMEELRESQDTFDAVQLHFLQDAWDLIPEYASWAKAWFPGKPFEFWEIGYGWPGEEAGEPFSEEGHAAGVIKTLVSALGEGASRVIYEPYWEEIKPGAEDRAARKFGRGLVTPDGPRLAATAFGTMVKQLSGYTEAELADLGAEVWAYRFATPRGDIYVVWAEQETTVDLPLAAAQVTVTDMLGATAEADPSALPVGTSPVFVTAP